MSSPNGKGPVIPPKLTDLYREPTLSSCDGATAALDDMKAELEEFREGSALLPGAFFPPKLRDLYHEPALTTLRIVSQLLTRVGVRLPAKRNSNSHGARPVY